MGRTTNDHIFEAITELKSDAIRMDADRKKDLEGVIAELRILNGRTRKNENAVTRLNLAVFGFGGTAALAAVGVGVKLLFG